MASAHSQHSEGSNGGAAVPAAASSERPLPVRPRAAPGDQPYPLDPLNPAASDSLRDRPITPLRRPPPLAASQAPPPLQRPAASPPVAVAGDENDSEQDRWMAALRVAPPWLVSCIFHMLLLILMGLIVTKADPVPEVLELTMGSPDSPVDALLQPLAPSDLTLTPDEPTLPLSVPLVDDPAGEPLSDGLKSAGLDPSLPGPQSTMRGLLSGREQGMRASLTEKYGGSAATEAAVQAGLGWLARQQQKSGQWSLVGPYADGGSEENHAAASGMALLAFQGAGYTPTSGENPKFREVVAKGWKSLLGRQNADGSFFRFPTRGREGNHGFYTHAIATLALCELFAMTRDEQYRQPAQRAVDFLVKSQSPAGGWKYQPQQRADLSVSGWVIMALQSARMAELNVPDSAFYEFEKFLDSVAHGEGREYAYEPRRAPSLAMSAEGLLCREFLGWPADDKRLIEGAQRLVENPVDYKSRQDVYCWYYATQVLHHLGGKPWEEWNKVMSVELPAHQVSKHKEAGSWNPMDDSWGRAGGRLYTTCLSLYMLEVYYRHLPIYEQKLNLRGGQASAK